MLHKAACVGVTFHAMVPDKHDGLPDELLNSCFVFLATATIVPFETALESGWVMFLQRQSN
jgi:hypothetical protein